MTPAEIDWVRTVIDRIIAKQKARTSFDVADDWRNIAHGLREELELAAIAHMSVHDQAQEALRENERLRRQRDEARTDAQTRLENCEAVIAANERLRVCGTCWHYSDYCASVYCDHDYPDRLDAMRSGVWMEPTCLCHFQPSRWTPYWEGG
jgi:hypothetical protein